MPSSDPFAEQLQAVQLPVGIHHGIPFPQYAAQRCMNASALTWGATSLKHVKAAFDGEIAGGDSQAKKFGRMVHLRLLEPARFHDSAEIATPCAAIIKSGERKGATCGAASQCTVDDAWFCGRHSPKTAYWPRDFVTEEEAARIERMAEFVSLDLGAGRTEVTLIADIHGVPCKGRADWLGDAIVDIKKCLVGAATDEECSRSIKAYDWHIQAALYVDLVRELTGRELPFRWLFIEDSPPFDTNTIEADEETIAIGRFEIQQTLRRWKVAQRTGVYPGVGTLGPDVRHGGLPDWYRERFADVALQENAPCPA